jgi:hypothetical protein
MPDARTPTQIRQLVRQAEPMQKIRKKPKKFFPDRDRRNTDKNKLKESYGGEGV